MILVDRWIDCMATGENGYFTEDEDDHHTSSSSLKRVITVSSEDEDKEVNRNAKRQRSSSLPKTRPLQLMNKQPVIRNTRQTSLSIVRTNSDDSLSEERKWSLKTITSSSSNLASGKQLKKKTTQTVNRLRPVFRWKHLLFQSCF